MIVDMLIAGNKADDFPPCKKQGKISPLRLITDSRDIGTYNFILSGDFGGNAGHVLVDVVPWLIFGNDDDDYGLVVNKIIKLFE